MIGSIHSTNVVSQLELLLIDERDVEKRNYVLFNEDMINR